MLKLALPNGSLEKPTLELLEKIGVKVLVEGRSSEAQITGVRLFEKAVLMRPQDIPHALACLSVDCGITGWDWIVEYKPDLMDTSILDAPFVITELEYAKISRVPVRIVLFRHKNNSGFNVESEDVSISSEYPNLTRWRFPRANVQFSHGSTEIKVKTKMFDFGVGVTETGTSIRDNDLTVVETLLVSPVVFMAREWTPEIKVFGQMLRGALEAESLQLLKMNVSEKYKQQVANLLPALKAPTVSQLADGSFAFETVAPKADLVDLLIKLRAAGATDILVQDMNIVLP